jgi:FKBP12-rapamycin complex-associated protein
VLPLYHKL